MFMHVLEVEVAVRLGQAGEQSAFIVRRRSKPLCAHGKGGEAGDNADAVAKPSRRTWMLLMGLAASAGPSMPVRADEGAWATVEDPILAYRFAYPKSTGDILHISPASRAIPAQLHGSDERRSRTSCPPALLAGSGKPLPFVFSRRPERYSSAAPLSADARQRNVCELVDLGDAVTLSVSVGPPSPILAGSAPSSWDPKTVAEAVLIDRSTARISSGQRVSLNSVEAVQTVDKGGRSYILYEHVSRGSPTLTDPGKETYRHAFSMTAVRNGQDGTPYLYTLTVQSPQVSPTCTR